MFFSVGSGADEALLFTTEEDEAEGSARRLVEGFDGAGDFEDGGDAGAVVLRAGGGMPGVEMGSDDDDGVGLFAAGDFGDDVADLSGGADAVFEGEVDGDGAFVEEALDEERVFETDLGDGKVGESSTEGDAAGVFGSVGAAGEENCEGFKGVEQSKGFEEVADLGILPEAGAVDEDNVAGEAFFCRVEFFDGKERGEIDDLAVDSRCRGWRDPSRRRRCEDSGREE